MLSMANTPLNKLRAASWRVALVATACGWLAVASAPAAAPKAAQAAAKPALRGMNWDSIKAMPDWSGMWTPGRPPASAAPARQGGPGAAPAAPGAAAAPPAAFVFGAGVPLTPKYAAIRDARMVLVRGQGDKGVDEIPLEQQRPVPAEWHAREHGPRLS